MKKKVSRNSKLLFDSFLKSNKNAFILTLMKAYCLKYILTNMKIAWPICYSILAIPFASSLFILITKFSFNKLQKLINKCFFQLKHHTKNKQTNKQS